MGQELIAVTIQQIYGLLIGISRYLLRSNFVYRKRCMIVYLQRVFYRRKESMQQLLVQWVEVRLKLSIIRYSNESALKKFRSFQFLPFNLIKIKHFVSKIDGFIQLNPLKQSNRTLQSFVARQFGMIRIIIKTRGKFKM